MKESIAFLDQDVVSKFFSNPLPGGENVWSRATLGPAHKWPVPLQAFTKTLASFAYPAALFWGDDFVLLHNQAWGEAGGIDQQGQPQRGSLSAHAWSSLRSSFLGKQPTRLDSREILRSNSTNPSDYTLLISPLFDWEGDGSEGPAGLLAQLLPSGENQESERKEVLPHRGKPTLGTNDVVHNPKEINDNVPLDQHPFFTHFAEMLPSGLAILDHRAEAVFVNQQFYNLTTHRGDDKTFQGWPKSIYDKDYDRVMDAYREAFTSQKQLRTEFRGAADDHPWRLLLLMPLGHDNLQHVSLREYGGFICSLVDITSEKSAELTERRAAEEARRRKEQQERFIDMISHEIRNPLSAVLHCSEDIEDAIKGGTPESVDIDAIKEAIDTINLCIQHQQNIVNDVLSFSKLDSSILSLSPKSCQPRKQVARSLKMFQPEFRKQAINFEFLIDHSYVDNDIGWVMADLPRIGQVLVNLVTNAIKFTSRSKRERKIEVGMGASLERPSSYPPNVVFFSSEEQYHLDSTRSSEWGNGGSAFIMIAVKDTGIGISDEGQQKLFQRFQQATPKTEEIYGGSGLGLNIARKICHIHGGEIGVSSKEDEGSTFGFFFRVRRSDAPEEEGSSDEDQVEEDRMAEQVRAQGNKDPESRNSADMPRSLDDTPVTSVSAASPGTSDGDDKWKHTAKNANKIQKGKSDEYAVSQRETVSRVHKSGEHLQSDDLKSDPSHATAEPKNNHTGTVDRAGQTGAGKPHLLLVEDNIINQRILFKKLEKHGFLVTTANNGMEAVDAVKAAPPHSTDNGDRRAFDVILMDQEMPRLDGNGASKAIRELEKNGDMAQIPILGVTANVRVEQQDEMIAAGMNDVISKPYKIDHMVERIQKLIPHFGGNAE